MRLDPFLYRTQHGLRVVQHLVVGEAHHGHSHRLYPFLPIPIVALRRRPIVYRPVHLDRQLKILAEEVNDS